MIDTNKSGYIVELEDGRLGRTIHEKGSIKGKIPVYIATEVGEKFGIKVPLNFSETGTLIDPKKLKKVGFID